MSVAFTSIVELCRISSRASVAGTNLIVPITKSAQAVGLVSAIEDGGWTATIRHDGSDTTKQLDRFQDGAAVEVVLHGVAKAEQVVVNNVATLLQLSQGRYLGKSPENYFLILENYASWEEATHSDVLAYKRALKVVALLMRLADFNRDRVGTAGEAIVLASRRLSIPIVYGSGILGRVSGQNEIDALEEAIFNDHHRDARRDIAKRVLVRFFDAVPENDRFSDLLSRVPELLQAFLADFDIYSSGFSFDKAREEFERKKLDFVVKINAATSDVMNKLIAIPVGQGILVSQMKREVGLELVNWALLIGSFIFALIAAVLIINQINTLKHIQEELVAEKNTLYEKARPTYEKLKGLISSLERKLRHHVVWVPVALGALILVTSAITLIAFLKFTGSIPAP